MPIIVIFLVAGLIYLLQDRIYKRFWNINLHADVKFEDRFIYEGEDTYIRETLSNGKILPLPWVYVKFQVNRNGKVSHYRSDLFSIRFYQKIQRRIPFHPEKRGIYTMRGIDLISNNLFITRKFVQTLQNSTTLVVYPKLISTEEFQIPFQKMMGDIITKRYMIEDPYMFKGIRDYQSYDSFKSINFKASARAGKWLVNVHDYTIQQKVTILLNMDRANQYYDLRLYENSIRMAASMAKAYEQEGIPVSLWSNGRDVITGEKIELEEGCGSGHLHTLFENLARIEISLDVEDFDFFMRRAIEDTDPNSMYLLISPFYGLKCMESYEEIQRRHESAMWILPVLLSDLTDPDFKGQEIADRHSNVFLWKVD